MKFAHKKKRPVRPPVLDLQTTTPEVKLQFNTILQELLQDSEVDCQSQATSPDHNSIHHVYTDGSGTGGRCTKHTPAGWGWCYKEGCQWKKAYGPVTADTSRITYRGATVGSNNTGEVTALLKPSFMHISKGGNTSPYTSIVNGPLTQLQADGDPNVITISSSVPKNSQNW